MRLIKRFTLRGVTFPIYAVVKPAALNGVDNGKIPPDLFASFDLAQGGTGKLLTGAPSQSWRALTFLASVDYGATLTATSPADTYRSYDHQVRGFLRRNVTVRIPFRPRRMWNGTWYWLRPGNAGIAVPGTSNHGLGLAVDHAIYDPATRKLSRPTAWLRWFVPQAEACGWSWEAPSEDWHIRYVLGDDVTTTVERTTKMLDAPLLEVGSTGPLVRVVQAIVGANADGKYGPKTFAAVRAWQARQTKPYGGRGLPQTGTWDADDWWAAGVTP